jgi:excisionase family DNA binding protein
VTTSIVPPDLAAVVQRDYTVADLATRLQCSERHLWRLIDRKAVPGVLRIGRLVRLHRATVDAWLAAGAPPQWRAARD